MKKSEVIKVINVKKTFKPSNHNNSTIKSIFTSSFSREKESISKRDSPTLSGINFTVQEGEFLGIVGRNGSGKSTLLKMLAGIYQPTDGIVTTEGRVVPFIELGVGFNSELSGRDNVYLNGALLGYSDSQIDSKYKKIVSFAELEKFMDLKLKNYSSGMQVRLAFSVATVLAESDILLIDEVLAVGDTSFQRKCYEYFRSIKETGKTVVFVSHDMEAIREFCTRAILIEKGKIVSEGKTKKVAREYMKLFTEKTAIVSKRKDRWGSEKVRIQKVTIEQKGKEIKIVVEVKSKVDIEDLIIGFNVHQTGSDYRLFGTNTNIGNIITVLNKNQTRRVIFEFENILGESSYTLDVAATSKDGLVVYDWWQNAAKYFNQKDTPLPYPIIPEIKCSIDV